MKWLIVGLVVLMILVGMGRAVETDSLDLQLYWTNRLNWDVGENNSVFRANADGSELEVVFAADPSGIGNATYISIHDATQKLYIYGFENDVNNGPAFVKRSNLDGTHLETVINSGLKTLQFGFDIDQTNNRMYMGSSYPWKRSNLDSSDFVELLNPTGVRYTHQIEVDEANSKVYFTRDQYGLFRMDLDGDNLETLGSVSHAFGLALDLANDRFFYSALDAGHSLGTNGDILSYDLLTGTSSPVASGIAALDLELDADTQTLYAITNTEIKSLDLIGGGITTVLTLPEPSRFQASLELHSGGAVPTPSSLTALIGMGLVGLFAVVRRRKRT